MKNFNIYLFSATSLICLAAFTRPMLAYDTYESSVTYYDVVAEGPSASPPKMRQESSENREVPPTHVIGGAVPNNDPMEISRSETSEPPLSNTMEVEKPQKSAPTQALKNTPKKVDGSAYPDDVIGSILRHLPKETLKDVISSHSSMPPLFNRWYLRFFPPFNGHPETPTTLFGLARWLHQKGLHSGPLIAGLTSKTDEAQAIEAKLNVIKHGKSIERTIKNKILVIQALTGSESARKELNPISLFEYSICLRYANMKDFFALFLDQLYKNLKELDSGTLEVIPNDSSQHFMLAVLPPLMSMVRQRNPELPLFLKGLFKVSLQQAPFLDGADLTGANFADADFEEISFRQAILINGNLSRGNFRGANFQLANLAGTLIENADLSEASLNLANLAKARLRGTRLNKADLEGASLIWADLTKTDLSNAHLKGANLNEAIATNAKFIRANLSGADLTGIMVAGAEFTGANLVGAILDRIIDLDKAKLDDAIISDNEWKYIQKLGIYERVSLKTEEREALIAKKWIRAEDPRHLYKLKRNGELNKDIASVFTIKRTREVGNRVTHWKFYYASVGINTLFVNYSRNVTKE